jgi:hypothetical protein
VWIPQGGPKRSGQNIDGSGQHSGDPGGEAAERIFNKIRGEPELRGLDEQKLKRVHDELRGALSGFSTTPQEDAQLQQSLSPEDEYYKQEIARWKKLTPFENIETWPPDEQRDFIDSVNAASAGQPRQQRPKQLARPQQEKPWSSDEFWNNPEELKKYTSKKL